MKRSDRLGKGYVSMETALDAMASYGAAPPAVSDADLTRVLSDHAVTRSAPTAGYRASGGSPGKRSGRTASAWSSPEPNEGDTQVVGISINRLCDALALAQEFDVTRTAREERVIQ